VVLGPFVLIHVHPIIAELSRAFDVSGNVSALGLEKYFCQVKKKQLRFKRLTKQFYRITSFWKGGLALNTP
jgi:hypothetical protein